MLLIREETVRRLLPMSEAIRIVRAAFEGLNAGDSVNQVRRRLTTPAGAVLHQLAGISGKYFGTKIYSTHIKHGAWFLVQLYNADTGRPLALIEANHLGQIRTGAASGVATDLLARPDADVLCVIGAGFQARTQLEAVRCVRALREVRVWSRNRARREAFAEEMNAMAPETAEEAVRGASIVTTITFAKDPVLAADWIAGGSHVNAAGSNNPQRRELPSELIARAELIAVDAMDQARLESGDLLLALAPADWDSPRVTELRHVCAGARGRTSPEGVTVFKSNGLGVQDVAAAAWVYEKAVAEGSAETLRLYS